MTEVLDRYDRRVARSATGELADLNAAGVIEAADVHVASRLATLVDDEDPLARVTLALVVRAAREGSTSLDPAHARELLEESPVALPPTPEWLEQVGGSALAEAGVLLVEHDLVYLDRYHREEVQIAQDLQRRAQTPAPEIDEEMLEAGLERVFPRDGWGEQRDAVRAAAGRLTTVLAGGPGTGKTSTVAGLLTLLLEQAEATGHRPRIALAAPTGKAAARLRESVLGSLGHMPEQDRQRLGTDIEAVTVHRLLGWRPDSGNRFRRDRGNPLPHDIVVVDEASMLSLTLTARLLEALRPGARLLLVGDPDQLASVEAGAVLADLVAGYGDDGPVARLQTSHRFGHEIGTLAEAVRVGDADLVLELLAQARPGGPVEHLPVADVIGADEALRLRLLTHAERLRDLALAGRYADALRELGEHRLLCAHRDGPWGVGPWNDRVERWLAEASDHLGRQVVGRPLLVTTNDRGLGLFNGDTGVMALRADHRVVGVFGEPDAPIVHAASTLGEVDTAHALTIHKSQGSQARSVTVLLPDADSRLLTRELLYTAITRAQESVTLVGSEAAVRAAVERRTQRATGLRHRV
ncbi:exodeoxyribonuclease V subunit alpha [Janibacter hoylei PVAS-1]|uniref:RecBCD enzyme subunit RecD n=1 Tax=Janibacter hoylei PVAS-1 TaxID=1210046 RepID=K1EUK3_9MICO|nr:exodeoxyribonuclease V subunit alpha [Janibacter hoylei]EKA62788.1 exodeoxyribonuclease V subunit alpha [Janibacter hoylei PVAS-1]RWU84337.1 exodeoxyribonuclease V subunit alpha [Janibacter hoylei PVAS-1]